MNRIENYLTLVADHVQRHKEKYWMMSHQIHERPEIGNEERFASTLLTNTLKEAGFEVKMDIATHPTGFIARKESLKKGPGIGFCMVRLKK